MRAIYLSLWTGSFGVTDEQAILLLVVVVLMAPKKIPPPNSSATTNVRVPIFFEGPNFKLGFNVQIWALWEQFT